MLCPDCVSPLPPSNLKTTARKTCAKRDRVAPAAALVRRRTFVAIPRGGNSRFGTNTKGLRAAKRLSDISPAQTARTLKEVDQLYSLAENDVDTGYSLVIQAVPEPNAACRFPSAKECWAHKLSLKSISFCPVAEPQVVSCVLTLHEGEKYAEVQKLVGAALNQPPDHIQFFGIILPHAYHPPIPTGILPRGLYFLAQLILVT